MTRFACLTGTLIAAAVGLACSGEPLPAPSALGGADGSILPATASGGGAASPMLAASHRGPEYADVSNQGGMGVYAPKGASLLRQPNGLQVSLSMPTPQPGTYSYPPGFSQGHPEIFTLWVFIFNRPDLCSVPCDLDDLGIDKPARGTVYNGGGHAASGRHLTIAGRIGVGETPFAHPVLDLGPLEFPDTAAVHLAVAPHGGLDPSTLPDEFRLPTGNPAFWWLALFE
jgi:hypothetical protein